VDIDRAAALVVLEDLGMLVVVLEDLEARDPKETLSGGERRAPVRTSDSRAGEDRADQGGAT
jgi:hypothetical protein